MMLTGRMKLVEKGDDKPATSGHKPADKEVVIEEAPSRRRPAPPSRSAKVKDLITAYVKTDPAPRLANAAAAPRRPPAEQPAASAPAPAAAAAAAARSRARSRGWQVS